MSLSGLLKIVGSAVSMGILFSWAYRQDYKASLKYARLFNESKRGSYDITLLGNLGGYYVFFGEKNENDSFSPLIIGKDLINEKGITDGKIDFVESVNVPEGHELNKYANKDSLQKAYDALLQDRQSN